MHVRRVRPLAIPAALAVLLAGRAAPAADVTLATQDGLEIALDAATGAVNRVTVDGLDLTDRAAPGGPFVRDRQRLLDVPPGAVNLLPNPSLEIDADADQVPDGWRFEDAWFNGATLTYPAAPAHDGSRAATINARRGGVLEALDVPVQGGTRYVLSAMARGSGNMQIYVVWKTLIGEFVLYESGHQLEPAAAYRHVHAVLQAPPSAALADIGIIMVSDGTSTIDMARMYVAPPETLAPLGGPVVATPSGARQTGTVPALGLGYDLTYTVLADRIDLDLVLGDTTASDRAIEAGFVLPVYASDFWDSARRSRIVTQQGGSEIFAYTWWGRMYNDGPWGSDRSIYPFAALTLLNGSGVAMGYDVTAGPQDVQLFHSTYVGQSFTALFRLGIAAEPLAFPRTAGYRLSLFTVDGADGFRSALDRTYRRAAGGFENRLPVVGGWTPWTNPQDIAGASDFGLAVHTWDDDVIADDQAGVLTFGHMSSFDYWLPLGDLATEPTPAEARARLDQNASQTADPALQRDARSVKVSGIEDALGEQVLEVYQAGWMPGSGWSAVCGINPDPEVTDLGGNGWAPRYDLLKATLDQRFDRARTAGANLDGALMDWFSSWHADLFNHRREHWTTCDAPLSFDPETLTPALPEYFSHHDSAAAVAAEMRGQGLFTMTRELHFPSFWASPLFDVLGREVEWQRYPEDDETLSYYRAVAGRKPFLLLHDADFANLDPTTLLNRSLLYGLIPAPYYDTAQDQEFWDLSALVERDRPVYRKYMPLFRLEATSGWEPVTAARSSDAAVYLERWGTKTRGPLLFSAWNSGSGPSDVIVTVDLAALGIAPAEVGRVVDLTGAGVIAGMLQGSSLQLSDRLDPGAARLYHLHVGGGTPSPLVLQAVKRGADVELSWTDAGHSLYELLGGPDPVLSGGGVVVELTTAPAFIASGAVPVAPSRYYTVE